MRPRWAEAVLLTAAALLLAAFFWPLLSPAEGRPDPADMTLLGPGAGLAVSSLNSSSEAAYDSLEVDVNETLAASSAAEAERASELLERAIEAAGEAGGSDLARRVARSASSYLRGAEAARSAASAALLLDSSRPAVREALDLLLRGNVEGALGRWAPVSGDVREARRLVGAALLNLSIATLVLKPTPALPCGYAS